MRRASGRRAAASNSAIHPCRSESDIPRFPITARPLASFSTRLPDSINYCIAVPPPKPRPFPANHHPLRWVTCHLGGPMRFRRSAGIPALFQASFMRELKAYKDDVLLDGYLAEA